MRDEYSSIKNFLFSSVKGYKHWYALMFQAPILVSFYPVMLNYGLRLIIDGLQSGGRGVIYGFLLCTFAEVYVTLVWVLSCYGELKCEPYVRRTIIGKIFQRVFSYDYSFFTKTSAGQILSRTKGILDGYDNVVNAIHHRFFHTITSSIVSVVFIAFASPVIGAALFVWLIVFCFVIYKMSKKINKLSFHESNAKHAVFGEISDCYNNVIPIVSSFSSSKETDRVKEEMTKDFIPRQVARYSYDIKLNAVAALLCLIASTFSILYCIKLHKASIITSGILVYIMTLLWDFLEYIWQASKEIKTVTKEFGDFQSSFDLIKNDHKTIDVGISNGININGASIKIENLSFSYGENVIFNGLNLEIQSGEKIGIVGHSGSGKSTLVSLLLKNYLPSSGKILIDGQDTSQFTSKSLKDNVSIIQQDLTLFSRTLFDNISYFQKNATLEDVIEVAKLVEIHDFINSLPQKYHTKIGKGGFRLSGGQRQRIIMARAMLKKAKILILDEATSALDSITEAKIQKSVDAVISKTNATTIAISHRLSTIKNMNRIIVMENGKIVEDGSFNELLSINNGKFKELWDHQVDGMIV